MTTQTTWTPVAPQRKGVDVRLVRLFDEYDDIEVSSIVQGRYEYVYSVVRVEGAKVTLEKMWEYVRRLRQKYPDRRFTIRRVVMRVNGRRRVFHVITRDIKGDPVGELDGSVPDLIPIYVSLRKQEFYVPERCVRENRKLTNFVILRVLGALGIARNKYLGIKHIM
jgi:predicted ester cyclase